MGWKSTVQYGWYCSDCNRFEPDARMPDDLMMPCKTCTRIADLEAESERRRALLERAYRAWTKPAWEVGETWNEVASDVEWEAISYPAMMAEHARAAARGEEG